MTIVIDVNHAIYEKAGIGRYTKNLARYLLKNDRRNDYIFYAAFCRRRKERLAILNELTAGRAKPFHQLVPAQWREWWWQNLPLDWPRLTFGKVNLYHALHISQVPRRTKIPVITTIYDLSFIYYPHHRSQRHAQLYNWQTDLAIKNSRHLITISESTKNDLVKFKGVPADKITVTYLGAEEYFRPIKNHNLIKRTLAKYNIIKPFVLTVGTLEPRKNLLRLLQSWQGLVPTMQQKYQLVLAGGRGWNDEELRLKIKNLKSSARVATAGYVDDRDLPYLYSAAELFIYPSLYEGFGLPVLEAMSCGCPVITSSTSSLPEVGGAAATYIDPLNTKDIGQTLARLLSNQKQRQQMAINGLKQAKKFSWNECAKKTISIYEQVGNQLS